MRKRRNVLHKAKKTRETEKKEARVNSAHHTTQCESERHPVVPARRNLEVSQQTV
jgi:hypothetical protein